MDQCTALCCTGFVRFLAQHLLHLSEDFTSLQAALKVSVQGLEGDLKKAQSLIELMVVEEGRCGCVLVPMCVAASITTLGFRLLVLVSRMHARRVASPRNGHVKCCGRAVTKCVPRVHPGCAAQAGVGAVLVQAIHAPGAGPGPPCHRGARHEAVHAGLQRNVQARLSPHPSLAPAALTLPAAVAPRPTLTLREMLLPHMCRCCGRGRLAWAPPPPLACVVPYTTPR
jgi:hypothetical protein